MPVVPIRPIVPGQAAPIPPPSPQFAMMAAAQMHKEGRLIKSGTEPDAQVTKVGDSNPTANDIPSHIYDLLDDHSKGNLTNDQLHDALGQQGWKANLRKRDTISVWPSEGGTVLNYP